MEHQRIEIGEENRKLLSVFMGEEYPLEVDFNWMMPVFAKIENYNENSMTCIYSYGCSIDICGENLDVYFQESVDTLDKLEAIIEVALAFIEWYNKSYIVVVQGNPASQRFSIDSIKEK